MPLLHVESFSTLYETKFYKSRFVERCKKQIPRIMDCMNVVRNKVVQGTSMHYSNGQFYIRDNFIKDL